VKRALQRARQMRADANELREGKGEGATEVQLVRGVRGNILSDKHGTRILEERVAKDETFSLPSRELTEMRLEREAIVKARGRLRQKMRNPKYRNKVHYL
jgi:hypothetical protein